MSLIEMRARWLKAARSISSEEPYGEHFVIAAKPFTANPLIPYLGAKHLDGAGSIPLVTVAPYDQIFQVCLNWQAMFSEPAPPIS